MKKELAGFAFVVGSICLGGAGLAGCHSASPGGVDFGGTTPPTTGTVDAGTSTLTLGATVVAPTAPPPISGGTLAVLKDGYTAVAADSDRDHIYVVDLKGKTKLADIALTAGDEPGRVIEDDLGRVHVVVRGGGALVTLDPTTWTIAQRRAICPSPRGVAYDATADTVTVACVGGELVTLPAASGAPTRTLQLDRDLRDVVFLDGTMYVSKFRSAELLAIDASGNVSAPITPAVLTDSSDFTNGGNFTPGGAWRLIALPDAHTVFMLHQRGTDGQIVTSTPGGYGGGSDPCSGTISHSTVTAIAPSLTGSQGVLAQPIISGVTLGVDFAYSSVSDVFAVVSAGNAHSAGLATVVYTPRATAVDTGDEFGSNCVGNAAVLAVPGGSEPTAVAFDGDDDVIVYSREPAKIMIPDLKVEIPLSTQSVNDTGHTVFHSNSGAGLACATCHLEGGEDGRTWSFDTEGDRRTQSIRGGIMSTAPFHWDGSLKTFSNVMSEVFVKRMSGPNLNPDQLSAMQGWVDHIPFLKQSPAPDAASVTRGQTVFEDPNVGCTSCHNGVKMTNNSTLDVGTQGEFQVPSLLGVGWRSPYLHDGRAEELKDRFTPSIGGGDTHGRTSQLTSAQIDDLIAYLNTL